MSTSRKGPITSDRVSQAVDKIKHGEPTVDEGPTFKTIDDLDVSETSNDLEPDLDEGDAPEPEPEKQPVAGIVSAADATAYPWVVRFAILTQQNPAQLVAEARADDAPELAVTKKSTGWVTLDRVHEDLKEDLAKIIVHHI